MSRPRILPVCALAAALSAGPATGQAAVGVHGGLSIARLALTGIEIQGERARRGMAAGASLTLPVSGRLGVRLEASFLQKGASWTDLKLGDVTAFVDYLQLAALGQVTLPLPTRRVSLHLLAGPAVARETGCEVKVEYALQPITLEGACTDEQTYNPTKPTDFSLVGGAGVQLEVARGVGVSLDFLYSHGLRSVYGGDLERSVHHRGVTLRAGLVLPVG